MAARMKGLIDWGLDRDDDNNHRDYTATFLVECDNKLDGPAIAISAPLLPATGDQWDFGDEMDPFAFCTPGVKAKPVLTKEPNFHWHVSYKFTTRPLTRCQSDPQTYPVLEPPVIRGNFKHERRPQAYDRYGKQVLSSSLEVFTGESVMFDESAATIQVTINVISFPLTMWAVTIDNVNDRTMWGFAVGSLKLSDITWERLVWGLCQYYWRVTFDFEASPKGVGFVRNLVDMGTRQINPLITDPTAIEAATGKPWNKNIKNFIVYKEKNGEHMRIPLDGQGRLKTAEDIANEVNFNIPFDYYPRANFFSLGVPADIGNT